MLYTSKDSSICCFELGSIYFMRAGVIKIVRLDLYGTPCTSKTKHVDLESKTCNFGFYQVTLVLIIHLDHKIEKVDLSKFSLANQCSQISFFWLDFAYNVDGWVGFKMVNLMLVCHF